MAETRIPHFQNDAGVHSIEIGVKEFMCCGASTPYDHPHVFLDMGSEEEIVCPYCSTVYKLNTKLSAAETNPEGCAFKDEAA